MGNERVARPGRRTTGIELAIVLVAWTGLTAAVGPTGEFPLNDDWTYARSVEILVNEGRLDLVYAAVPLVTQVAWGALFSLPFGFSFSALRISTWVLGLVGLVATYALLRSVRPPGRLALFGTLLLAVNPFYLSLSLTFMTDIPFLALALASIAALSFGMHRGARWQLGLGLALLVVALLVRQPAIAVAIGCGVALVVGLGPSRRSLMLGALPALACLGILLAYEFVIRRTIGLPPLYGNPYDPIALIADESVPAALSALVGRLALVLLYVGLFTLPVSLVVAGPLWRASSATARAWTTAVLVVAVGVAGTLWATGSVRPLGNVVYDVGIGPPLLRDVYLLGLRHLPSAPAAFWLAVALAGVAGLALLGLFAFVAGRAAGARAGVLALGSPAATISLVTALVLAGFLIVTGFLDRYLLPLIPLAMVGVMAMARPLDRPRLPWVTAGLALLIAFGLFSVAGTHDYFAWNRARWQALDYLTRELGVAPSQIDGGLEFHGWFRFRSDDPEDPVLGWSRRAEEYVVAFGPIDDYSEVDRYSYDRWLPPGYGEVLVLRKMGER